MLFFCRHLKGRVAFLWVEQRRAEGAKSTVQTEELLQDSVKDLKICRQYLETTNYKDRNIKAYRVLHDLVRATLTWAEVEMDLRRPDVADKKLNASRHLMISLDEAAQNAELDDSTIANLKRRLKSADDRFKASGQTAGGGSERFVRSDP